jgi:hypothetical protein
LNATNLRQDYALSDFDQRKRFTMSGYYVPPFSRIQNRYLRNALDGFQLSAILALYDGRPFSGSLSGNPTPAGTTSGPLGMGGSSRMFWVGRNVYTSPGGATLDARLAREFRIKERMRLQLIAESFNVLNRLIISRINTTAYSVGSGTTVLFPRTDFKTMSEAGSNLVRERQYQLGARFQF